jgi:hypothetical protein
MVTDYGCRSRRRFRTAPRLTSFHGMCSMDFVSSFGGWVGIYVRKQVVIQSNEQVNCRFAFLRDYDSAASTNSHSRRTVMLQGILVRLSYSNYNHTYLIMKHYALIAPTLKRRIFVLLFIVQLELLFPQSHCIE